MGLIRKALTKETLAQIVPNEIKAVRYAEPGDAAIEIMTRDAKGECTIIEGRFGFEIFRFEMPGKGVKVLSHPECRRYGEVQIEEIVEKLPVLHEAGVDDLSCLLRWPWKSKVSDWVHDSEGLGHHYFWCNSRVPFMMGWINYRDKTRRNPWPTLVMEALDELERRGFKV